MQTKDREVVRVDAPAQPPKPGWLIALTVVLAVALVALGTWVVIDQNQNKTLPVAQVMDIQARSVAAWSEADVAELQALYAQDAVFTDGVRTLEGRDEIVSYAASLDSLGFVVESASTPTVTGNTVASAVTYGAPGDMAVATAVLELNSDGLIVRHTVEDVFGVKVTG